MLIQAAAAGAMLGIVVLITAPSLVEGRRWAHRIGNAYANVSMRTLRVPAISVSPHVELALRRRSHSRKYHAEKISVGDVARMITKTPGTIGWWGGRPFTMIDEKYGSTFSLRDVLVGYREHQQKQDGGMLYKHYQYDENQRLTGMQTYVRAFFEFAERHALSMDLSESVHPITDGAEDATAWDRVREGVKRMFSLQQQSVSVLKLALPMLAVVGGFLAGFYFFGPGRLPGESGTSQPIGVGATLLLLAAGGGAGGDDESDEDTPSRIERLQQRVRAVERQTWKRLGLSVGIAAAVVIPLVLFQLTFVVFVSAALGIVVLLPLTSSTLLSVLPATLAESIAETWMTLALKAFADPIINEEAGGEYEIYESEELPDVGSAPRYRFCKSKVGFSCDVSPEAFGEAGLSASQLEEYRSEVRADGGDVLPAEVEPTDCIENAGHQGFIPRFESVDSQRRLNTFVRTDRWLARFADASTGKISEKSQQEAIKEFAGGEPPFTDRQIMLFSLAGLAGGMIFSFILWGL